MSSPVRSLLRPPWAYRTTRRGVGLQASCSSSRWSKTPSTWRFGADELAVLGEPAVVAEVHDVPREPLDVRAGCLDEATPCSLGQQLGAKPLGHDRGDAGPGDPRVVAGLEPVVVGQRGEATVAPLVAPGVLDEEPDVVVADDAEGMATDCFRGVVSLDDVQLLPDAANGPLEHAWTGPAVVDAGRGDDPVELVDGGLHVIEACGVDSVERAEWSLERQPVQLRLVEGRLLAEVESWPLGVGQEAVVVPALEGPTQRGADICFSFELVVPTGEGVEHVGADVGRV